MSDNTVNSDPSFYKITVVTEDTNVNVTQGITKVVEVVSQGPQGPAGSGGDSLSDLTALNSFSGSMLAFTESIQTQVNNITNATSSYVLTSATSSMIVSRALTASYYQETDPIFAAKSGSLATTGSNTFIGNQGISGSIYLRSGSVINSTIGADIIIKAGVGFNAGVALYNNNSTQYLAVDDTGSYANKFTVAGSVTSPSFTGSLFGTASWAESASQALTASFVTGAVLQGGNSFGNAMVIGTNDAQNLAFETNGVTKFTISPSGSMNLGPGAVSTNYVMRLASAILQTQSAAVYIGIVAEPTLPNSASTQTSFTNYGVGSILNASSRTLITNHAYFRAQQGTSEYQIPVKMGTHAAYQASSNIVGGIVNYGTDLQLIESKSSNVHRNFNVHARGGAPSYFSGSVFIGHQTVNGNFDSTAKLHIKGDKQTGAQVIFLLENSSSIAKARTLIQVTNDRTSSFGTHLIPVSLTGVTSSYDLGTPSAAWRSLYVANGSIYFITGGQVSSSFSSSIEYEVDPDTGEEFPIEVITEIATVIATPTSASMKVTPAGTFTFDGPVAIVSGSISASIGVNQSGSITFGAPIIVPTGSNVVTFPYSGSAEITGSLIISSSGTFTNIGPAIFSGSVVIHNLGSDTDSFNSDQYGLYDATGVQSVDWTNRTLKDAINSEAINWDSRVLLNNALNATVNWNSGTLNDGANLSLNWDTRTLVDPSTVTSVDWDTRTQYDTFSSTSIDWANRTLTDNSNTTTIDWQNKVLKQAGNRSTVDWGGARLNDYSGEGISVDWESRFLYDNGANQSIDWQSRVFYASDGATPHIDWSNPSYIQLTSINENPILNVLGIDGGGRVYYTASSAFGGGGGSTTPGGSNTQIQYNSNNAFDGVPTLTYSGSLLRATGSFSGSFTGNLIGTASIASSVTNLSQSLNLTGSFNIQIPGNQPTISGTGGGFTSTLVLGKYPTLTAPENGGILLEGPSVNLSASSIILRDGANLLDMSRSGFIGGSPILMQAGKLWLSASNGISASGDLVPGVATINGTQSLGQYSLGSPSLGWNNLYISGGGVTFVSGSSSASIQLGPNNAITFSNAVIPNGVSFVGSGSIITGSTAISSSYGLLIPANTFTVGDMVRVHGVFTKPIAGTSTSFYIYVNTSNTLSGATQLALFNTTTNRWIPITRTLSIESPTSTTLHTTTLAAYNDEIATNTAAVRSSVNIDWSADQYLLFAADNASLADRTDTFRFYAKKI